jgi:hypothetical protein
MAAPAEGQKWLFASQIAIASRAPGGNQWYDTSGYAGCLTEGPSNELWSDLGFCSPQVLSLYKQPHI